MPVEYTQVIKNKDQAVLHAMPIVTAREDYVPGSILPKPIGQYPRSFVFRAWLTEFEHCFVTTSDAIAQEIQEIFASYWLSRTCS